MKSTFPIYLAALPCFLACSASAQAIDGFNPPNAVTNAVPAQTATDEPKPANATPFTKPSESYFAIFGGKAIVADGMVSATATSGFCFFGCPLPTTVSNNTHYYPGSTGGLRWGEWWDSFGLAIEYSHMSASSALPPTGPNNGFTADISYDALSFIPMLRHSLFRTETMPHGYLDLYGGFGLSLVMNGNISVSSPQLLHPVSKPAGHKFDLSPVALIGVSVKYSHLVLFAEERYTDVRLDASDTSSMFASSDVASAQINSRQSLIGIALRFDE